MGLQQACTILFREITLELDSLDHLVSLGLGVTTIIDSVGNVSLGEAIASTQFSAQVLVGIKILLHLSLEALHECLLTAR